MTQIKLRRDTSAAFASSNPILGNGEPAYETDTKKLKIGDGTTAYTQLEYFSSGGGGSTNITATLPLKIVDGVISLEVDGQTIQIVDGKLHANLDELSNTVNTLSDDVGTAFDLINIAQEDIANKQDKFTPELPLAINSATITTTVPESVTESAESWTGGSANSQVIVDISALNIDANSNWTLHLSGYMGDWKNSRTDTAHFNILTDKDTIFTFWHGSSHFRLGINTDVFNQIPDVMSEFYYEITYQKDATQFTFNGPNLVSTDPLLISKMSREMGQTPYTTLAGKGKLKSFGFPIFSKTFQRIDKDISKSYFEADGVKYPITSSQAGNTLKLGIGSGLSVVDGKLTATGGITIDDILPDYTARIELGGYTSASNQFTAPCAGYIVPLISLAFNTEKYAPYINNVRHGYGAIDQTPSTAFSDVFFIVNKGDKFYAEGITSYLDAGGFYPMKGANK